MPLFRELLLHEDERLLDLAHESQQIDLEKLHLVVNLLEGLRMSVRLRSFICKRYVCINIRRFGQLTERMVHRVVLVEGLHKLN